MEDGTRVNLQYSISVSELPGEVDRLFDKLTSRVKEISSDRLSKIGKEGDRLSLKAATELKEIRHSLTSAVCIAEDLENIINGYVSYKSRPQQTQPTAPQQPAPTPSGPASVNDLMSKLNAFKQLRNLENEEPHTIEEQEV